MFEPIKHVAMNCEGAPGNHSSHRFSKQIHLVIFTRFSIYKSQAFKDGMNCDYYFKTS